MSVSDAGTPMLRRQPGRTLPIMADHARALPMPLLTKRRSVDLCRVATCLCR